MSDAEAAERAETFQQSVASSALKGTFVDAISCESWSEFMNFSSFHWQNITDVTLLCFLSPVSWLLRSQLTFWWNPAAVAVR